MMYARASVQKKQLKQGFQKIAKKTLYKHFGYGCPWNCLLLKTLNTHKIQQYIYQQNRCML